MAKRVWLLCSAVLAPAALVAAGVGGAAPSGAAPTLVLTEGGVAGLRLGRPLAEARRTGLIGPTRRGCELVLPRPLYAPLKAPLRGFATFGGGRGHPLIALSVDGGAQTVRHIAPGATAAAVRRAYPEAHPLTSRPTDPIQLTALIVKRKGADRIWFMLDRPRGHVTELDVPAPQVCE